MRTTFALFLVLPAVLPSKISIARPKRQCPCIDVMPMRPPCKCLAGISAQCTCLRAKFQPVCPCALQWEFSECRAACLRTCASICARSVFTTTCPASCGHSCSHSCIHQNVVPIHVVMPKHVPVERCLSVCQELCTRSCTAVFTIETCTSLCTKPCERRCIKMFPILKHKVTKIRTITEKRVFTVKNCSALCRPRCEPQCTYSRPYPVPTLIEKSRPIFGNNFTPYPTFIPTFQEAAQAKLAPFSGKALQKPKNEASSEELLSAEPSKAEEFQLNPLVRDYIQEQNARDMQNPMLVKENLDQQLLPYEPSFGPALPTGSAASQPLLNNPSVSREVNSQQLYSFEQGESTASYRDGMGEYKQYPSLGKQLEFSQDAPSEMPLTVPEHMTAAMPKPFEKQQILRLDEAEETFTKLPSTQQPQITVSDVIKGPTPFLAEKTFYPEKDTKLQEFQSKSFSPSTREDSQQLSAGYDLASTSEDDYRNFPPLQVSMEALPAMEKPYSSSLPKALQPSSIYSPGKEDELMYRFQQSKLAKLRPDQMLPRQSGYIGVPSAAHGYAAYDRQTPFDKLSRFSAKRESVLEKTRSQQKLAAPQSTSIAERGSFQKDLRSKKEAERPRTVLRTTDPVVELL